MIRSFGLILGSGSRSGRSAARTATTSFVPTIPARLNLRCASPVRSSPPCERRVRIHLTRNSGCVLRYGLTYESGRERELEKAPSGDAASGRAGGFLHEG